MLMRSVLALLVLLASHVIAQAQPVDGCTSDADCKGGRSCQDHRCVTVEPLTCTKDVDCPGELICGDSDGKQICVSPQASSPSAAPAPVTPPPAPPSPTQPSPTPPTAAPPTATPPASPPAASVPPAPPPTTEATPPTVEKVPFKKRVGTYASVGVGYLNDVSATLATSAGIGRWETENNLGMLFVQLHMAGPADHTGIYFLNIGIGGYHRSDAASVLFYFGYLMHRYVVFSEGDFDPGLGTGIKLGKYLGKGVSLHVGFDAVLYSPLNGSGTDLASLFSSGLDVAL